MGIVAIKGSFCTGHGAFPPRPSVEGDNYLTINGKEVHCEGHKWGTHCDPTPTCHSSVLASGSSYFEVNGAAVGRVGDPVACGGTVATGDDYFEIAD